MKAVLQRIVTDINIWAVSALLCILWRVAADKEAILVYVWLFLAMMILWIFLGLRVSTTARIRKYGCGRRW